MGVVFLAYQRGLKRYVALKQMRLRSPDSRAHERFLREAHAAAILTHPGIVAIYDSGVESGVPWYAMEYLPGGDLAQRIERQKGPSPWQEAVRMMVQVARAVDHAHRCGIVHRDLKPSNILLSGEGLPKVADFGLARIAETPHLLTLTGEVMGTPAYMAPEHLHGAPLSDRAASSADVYSLGALLFHLLTGRPPYLRGSVPELLDAIAHAPPPQLADARPDLVLPRRLSALCNKTLAKTAKTRPSTASAFADELASSLTERPRRVRTNYVRKAKRQVLALAVTVVLASGAALALARIHRRVAHPVCLVLPVSTAAGADIPAIMSSGLQTEVAAALLRITDLTVILAAPQSAFPAEGSATRADARLRMQISRWQDNYRIQASLESAVGAQMLWSETFDRPTADVFDLQTDIAIHVASALNANLAADHESRQMGSTSRDPEAESLFLEAKLRQADGSNSVTQLSNAEQALRKAVALDSRFAAAFAELSSVETLEYAWGNDRSPARLQDALANAQAALRLNPLLMEGEIALGDYFLRASKDFPLARVHFENALRLAPGNKKALAALAFLLRREGDFAASADRLKQAMRSDPQNALLAFNTVTAFMWLRRYEEANDLLNGALACNPHHVALRKIRGDLYLAWKGDLGPMTDDILHRSPALPTPELYVMDKIEWLELSGRGSEALAALRLSRFSRLDGQAIFLTRAGYEALILSWQGETGLASMAAARATPEVLALLKQRPNDSRIVLLAGQLDLIRGDVSDGIGRMRRTITTGDPACADAWDKGFYLRSIAIQLACAGHIPEAVATVRQLLQSPDPYSLPALRLHPVLGPICKLLP